MGVLVLRLLLPVALCASALMSASCVEVRRSIDDDDDDFFSGDDDSAGDDDTSDDDDAGDDDDVGDDDVGDDDTGDDDVGDDDVGDDDSAASPCTDSPLIGQWAGTFDGVIDSSFTGTVAVAGTMGFEIVCADRLFLNGTMAGSEASGVAFTASIAGEYDTSANLITAALTGSVAGVVPFTGTMNGQVTAWGPYVMAGPWDGVAPSVGGTGSGTWTATKP